MEETLCLNFPNGDFEDTDIPDFGLQDWDYYDTITFWVALDNFSRKSADLTKTTRREARYNVSLRDANGNTVTIPLSSLYGENNWGTVRYHHTGTPEEYMNEIRDLTDTEKSNGEAYSKWKRVKITPNNIDPSTVFDFGNVAEFRIRYTGLTVSWTVVGGTRRVEWWGSYFRYIDENGIGRSIDNKYMEGDLYNDPPAPNDGYYYLADDSSSPWFWIRWFEDPDSSTEIRMREDVLMPTLRIDRFELPGKPSSNGHLQYGLPRCLRLEVSNWQEFQ